MFSGEGGDGFIINNQIIRGGESMIKKIAGLTKVLCRDEKGSYFVEMALMLMGVALVVFLAASELSSDTLVPKYNEISNKINSVQVPNLN